VKELKIIGPAKVLGVEKCGLGSGVTFACLKLKRQFTAEIRESLARGERVFVRAKTKAKAAA
jgi:hypothetical protein